MSTYGKVVVLMGGDCSEREISLETGACVITALQDKGIEVEAIDVVPGFVGKLIAAKPDRVFVALHGLLGEGGGIQGLLETLEIPYTGSRVLGSALAMDKIRSKKIWQARGLPTLPFIEWKQQKDLDEFIDSFGLPIAVKPIYEGSSFGITKLKNKQDAEGAYALAAQYGKVMLESWIVGDEYTVGILNNKSLPVLNVVAEEGFYDYDAKYISKETKYHCPGPITEKEQKYLQRLACDAFDMVDATGWGRVDFMRDLNGDFWILEVNTVPGLTAHSLVPKAAEHAGISFAEMVLEILDQTLSHNYRQAVPKFKGKIEQGE